MGSFSMWHWLVVLAIVMLIFGAGKLRNIGADLGGAVKGFMESMRDGASDDIGRSDMSLPALAGKPIDGVVTEKAERAAHGQG